MDNWITLDKNYSTTKFLTKEKNILEYKLEYKLEQQLFWPEEENRQGEGGLRTIGYFKNSFENKPLISIVTVVYNGEDNLEQTIESLLNQSYDNVEYIIIDGGSTDGTLDIIKKYEDQIDYWVSESDGGIYSAMNKGLSLCTGDYVAFLNADDWYNENTVEIIVVASENGSIDYIYGNVDMYHGNHFHRTFTERRSKYKVKVPFGHPSLFVKTCHMMEDPFNLRYKVVADYNFILGLMAKQLSYTYINKSIVNFREGGISGTLDYDMEKLHVYCSNFGLIRGSYSYLLITNNPFLKKSIIIWERLLYLFKIKSYEK